MYLRENPYIVEHNKFEDTFILLESDAANFEIRVTIDGTAPTAASALYSEPATGGTVHAALFMNTTQLLWKPQQTPPNSKFREAPHRSSGAPF